MLADRARRRDRSLTDVAVYKIFGLAVSSELALPGLPLAGTHAPDVTIRFGTIDAAVDAEPGYHLNGEGAVLIVPDVARYAISGGREIVIHPAPGASDRNMRVFLLGSAVGALLHQRGLLPLHANAIVLDGRAFAFMGSSGAGKSTLAAWFLDRGHPILSDDVCAISWSDNGEPIAHRGLLRLRLWREALERTGRQAEEDARSFDDQDKFDVTVPSGREAPATVPLGGVILLRRSDAGSVEVERLSGAVAIDALMSNIYRGGYARLAGTADRLLGQCVRLAREVPIMEVRRAWGRDQFDDQAISVRAVLSSF